MPWIVSTICCPTTPRCVSDTLYDESATNYRPNTYFPTVMYYPSRSYLSFPAAADL